MKADVPYEFLLDYISPQKKVDVKPMFGSYVVYVNDRMIFFLRDREDEPEVNGVWVAAAKSYYEELAGKLSMNEQAAPQSKGENKWLLIHKDRDDFESIVLRACELVNAGDRSIGRPRKGSKS